MSASQHDEYRPFEVDVSPNGNGVRVSPDGEIDIATVDRVEARIGEQLAAGHTRLELDMGAVTFMDSTGIRLLVQLTRTSQRDHWELTLSHIRPPVWRVLELSGVLDALSLGEPETA